MWSRLLFTSEGTVLGTFAILIVNREVRIRRTYSWWRMRATSRESRLSATGTNKHCSVNLIGASAPGNLKQRDVEVGPPANRRGSCYESFQGNAMRRVRLAATRLRDRRVARSYCPPVTAYSDAVVRFVVRFRSLKSTFSVLPGCSSLSKILNDTGSNVALARNFGHRFFVHVTNFSQIKINGSANSLFADVVQF